MGRLPGSAATCKELGHHPSHLTTGTSRGKIPLQRDDFSWTCQKSKVTGQGATLKSGDTEEYRDHSQDLDLWSRSCWDHKLVGCYRAEGDSAMCHHTEP